MDRRVYCVGVKNIKLTIKIKYGNNNENGQTFLQMVFVSFSQKDSLFFGVIDYEQIDG